MSTFLRTFLTALGTMLLVGAAAAAPSFDCSKARLWSEKSVCDSEALSALDREAAQLFASARNRLSGEARDQLITGQKAWLRAREGCQPAADPAGCLRGVYEKKIRELGSGTETSAQAPAAPSGQLIANVCWMGNECMKEYLISSVRNGEVVKARVRDISTVEGRVTNDEVSEVTVSCRSKPQDNHANAVEYTRWMAVCQGRRTDWSPEIASPAPSKVPDEQLSDGQPSGVGGRTGESAVGGTASSVQPSATDSAVVEEVVVKDGSKVRGQIASDKARFRSTFGEVSVAFGDVEAFDKDTLRLKDGSVLKGRFAAGGLKMRTSLGVVEVPLESITAIGRGASAVGGQGPSASTSTRDAPHVEGGGAARSVEGGVALDRGVVKDAGTGAFASVQPQVGQGILTGRILDNFGQSLAGATVRITGTSLMTETRPDGSYGLPYVPGSFVVRVERVGYDPLEFGLQLAQASSYPVEDKQLVKVAPGAEVYFWGKTEWVSLARCRVVEAQKDPQGFSAGGVSRYAAVGRPSAIGSAGTVAFLDATGAEMGLLLYPVKEDDTIIRLEREGGFGGFLGGLQSAGPAGGSLEIGQYAMGAERRIYEGWLAPGVYAFVAKPWGPYRVVYPTDTCFKFEVK